MLLGWLDRTEAMQGGNFTRQLERVDSAHFLEETSTELRSTRPPTRWATGRYDKNPPSANLHVRILFSLIFLGHVLIGSNGLKFETDGRPNHMLRFIFPRQQRAPIPIILCHTTSSHHRHYGKPWFQGRIVNVYQTGQNSTKE